MRRRTTLSLLAAASMAAAAPFHLEAAGDYGSGSKYAFVMNQGVTAFAGPVPTATSVRIQGLVVSSPGNAYLSNGRGTLEMDLTFVPTFEASSGPFGGTWTVRQGDGAYAGVTGSGTFSGSVSGGVSTSAFDGSLSPVPEPTSMLALAMGGLALARRRRK